VVNGSLRKVGVGIVCALLPPWPAVYYRSGKFVLMVTLSDSVSDAAALLAKRFAAQLGGSAIPICREFFVFGPEWNYW
jgi:hypothetical protein